MINSPKPKYTIDDHNLKEDSKLIFTNKKIIKDQDKELFIPY